MTRKQNPSVVLMLVATSVAGDTRVLREAGCVVELGLEVVIVGRAVPVDVAPPKGISILSASGGSGLRPSSMDSLTTKKLSPLLSLARWLLLPTHRKKSFKAWAEAAYDIASPLTFDAVHAHDFTALELGARLAKEHGVPLIYDSHEWWIGRQRQYRATPLMDRQEARTEAELASRAAAVITVGESIAELIENKRGVKKVFVVRNSFPIDSQSSKTVASPPKCVLYAGRIDAFRELEVTMEVSDLIKIPICWMGEYDNQWAANYVPRARELGIEVLKSQPIASVTTAMQNAGLVFVTHSDKFESHRLALPNKLFHAVHAGVPVIATNVSELARIVRKHDIGELYQPSDSKSMQEAIERATARHSELIANVKVAQKALSWDRDAQVLRDIYLDVLAGEI